MRLEWSDDALADLDRFAQFLRDRHPSLAAIVAREIIDKAAILAERPQAQSPAGQNTGKSFFRSPTRRMSSNIASMVNAWSCCGSFMAARRATSDM